MTTAIIAGCVIAIGLAAALIFVWRRRTNPGVQIQKADKAAREGRAAVAELGYRRTLLLLASPGTGNPAMQEIASRAHLALAAIESARGERRKAAGHYADAKALGASLAIEQTLLLAEWYAEREQKDEDAISAYLEYMRSGPKSGSAAIQVYSVMHGICAVSEEMKTSQRRPLSELNRRVVAANPGVEWAYYFQGLASLLDGRATEAIPAMMQALALNPSRKLTCYWLAVCHLQAKDPSLETAMKFIDQFIAGGQKDGKNRKREARFCAEISRRLVERAGGVGVAKQALSAQQGADLDKAIHYLQIAVEHQPADAATQHSLGRAYRLKGAVTEALAALRKAAELVPSEKLYAFDLGMQCVEAGHVSDAIEALETAVRICPTLEEAHQGLARIYFEQQKLDLAATHFQQAFACYFLQILTSTRGSAAQIRPQNTQGEPHIVG